MTWTNAERVKAGVLVAVIGGGLGYETLTGGNPVELLLLLGAMVAIPVGLKLLILLRWHRAGLRWPGEDLEDYIEHSPRFEDGKDKRTGMTVEQYREWATTHSLKDARRLKDEVDQ